MKERISISLEKETATEIKKILGKTVYRNQSHFVESAIEAFIKKQKEELKHLEENE